MWIEYHSPEWMLAVETGWYTGHVEELPSGVRMAYMRRWPRRRH